MKAVFEILKEQIINLHLILRLAIYNTKSKYQSHHLGAAWNFLNPVLQIGIYWFVFGIGIRGGKPIGEVPFFIWLMVGLIPWLFLSSAIVQGANSIYTKVSLVAKMKFPVSVLPTISIIGNAFGFVFMLIFLIVLLFIYQINPGIYMIQLIYYLICVFVFLFAVSLLLSTISTIIRDFQMLISSFIRMGLYLSGVLWDINSLPEIYVNILKLNPLYYLIDGFRKTFLYHEWFFVDWVYMSYFWILTLLILFTGALIHNKFRKQFVDYI
jgi:teichoic acid transport system permease protein